jgi:hypothetical protein
MTDKPDQPEKPTPAWTSAAALAGAAIGSAALVAALLYASRRKERSDKAAKIPTAPSESDT